ncbi:hypothetical protein, partial [Parendozoicomonas sp. Alg238-R29]|uniref:hypothetical protein n=1 Tax=Parendozoicomonas sp. Alg238-R29 TaxID=2993446 RepID=UPI00248F0D0F
PITRQKPVLRSIVHAPTCIVNRAGGSVYMPIFESISSGIKIVAGRLAAKLNLVVRGEREEKVKVGGF